MRRDSSDMRQASRTHEPGEDPAGSSAGNPPHGIQWLLLRLERFKVEAHTRLPESMFRFNEGYYFRNFQQ